MTIFAPTGTLTMCNAGHPSPLIFRAKRGKWAAISDPQAEPEAVNLPLGVVEEAGFKGRKLALEPGDCVLAYTDCLIEASNDRGELLGSARLLEELNALAAEGGPSDLSTLPVSLIERIEARGYRMDDDLTAVLMHWTERAGGASGREQWAGLWRGMVSMFTGRPIPWPGLNLRNLGSMFMPGGRRERSERQE